MVASSTGSTGSTGKTTIKGLGLIAVATTATVLIAGLLLSSTQFREFLEAVEAYSDNHMLLTLALYMLCQALVVILLFPGLIFTLLAGYLFGPLLGSLVVISGTVIGASCAFMIARQLFSAFFQRVLQRNPTFAVIAESVAHDGWKTVMLTRTIPLFPFKLSNYCFGVIPVSLREFALGTLLGVIPLTVTNVSLGALAADIGGLLEGRESVGSAQFALIALGIVSGIVTFILVRKRAKEKFAALKQHDKEQQNSSGAVAPSCEGSRG